MSVRRLKFLEGSPASCCNPLTCRSICLHCDCILFLFHFVVAECTCVGAGVLWLGWPPGVGLMTHPSPSCYDNAYWLGVGVVHRRITPLGIPGSSPGSSKPFSHRTEGGSPLPTSGPSSGQLDMGVGATDPGTCQTLARCV